MAGSELKTGTHRRPALARLLAAAAILGTLTPLLVLGLSGADPAILRLHGASLGLSATGGFAFSLLFLVGAGSLLGPLAFRVIYFAAALYSAAFAFAYVYHYLLFGQFIGDPSLAALLDSNPQEALEFIGWGARPDRLLLAGLPALAILAALLVARPREETFRLRRGAALGALAAALLLFGAGLQIHLVSHYNHLVFPVRAGAYAMVNKSRVEALRAEMRDRASDMAPVRAPADGTHVLVIGEATTSRHMGLYGYARDTTPRLEALRDELLIVRNSCSSRGATVPSLQEMLSFATREDIAPLYAKPGLLDIMKAARFKTYWISNQQQYGKFDNWSAILSEAADHREFLNRVGWSQGSSLDDQVLEPLREALRDPSPRKFIVVHLLGAHADYALRYPLSFAHFDGMEPPVPGRRYSPRESEMYNAYDNAVLYTDHIVGEIIAAAKAADPAGTVTFLSDHGEALGETSDFWTHLDGWAPKQVYQIPTLFHVPQARREELPEAAIVNLGRPFQSDRIIHSLLDLYRIDHPDLRREHSLFSPSYTPGLRYCDTLPGGESAPGAIIAGENPASRPVP